MVSYLSGRASIVSAAPRSLPGGKDGFVVVQPFCAAHGDVLADGEPVLSEILKDGTHLGLQAACAEAVRLVPVKENPPAGSVRKASSEA